jgi:hypothetical protein
MTTNQAAKASGRRGKGSQKQGSPETTDVEPETTDVELVAAEVEPEATDVEPLAAEVVRTSTVNAEDSKAAKEDTMTTDKVVQISARPVQSDTQQPQGAIELHQPTSIIRNLPAMSSEFEVKGSLTIAGDRPISASGLAIYGSYLNGRPISASNLKIYEMLPGNRPVFESSFKTIGALHHGERPIMVSDPQLMTATMLLGNRPIASNEIGSPESPVLMGYLD